MKDKDMLHELKTKYVDCLIFYYLWVRLKWDPALVAWHFNSEVILRDEIFKTTRLVACSFNVDDSRMRERVVWWWRRKLETYKSRKS